MYGIIYNLKADKGTLNKIKILGWILNLVWMMQQWHRKQEIRDWEEFSLEILIEKKKELYRF